MDTAESMSTVDADETGTAVSFTAQGWLGSVSEDLREQSPTRGSNPPASLPRQEAVGGDSGEVIIDQERETNDPAITKNSQYL